MRWAHGLSWLPFRTLDSSTGYCWLLLGCTSSLLLAHEHQDLGVPVGPGVDDVGPISLR